MASRRPPRFVVALIPVLLLASPRLSSADYIKVTTATDDVLVNGNCTLREAVIAANTDSPVDRCAAGHGADVIFLAAGTYVLSLIGPNEGNAWSGDLNITGDLVIRGSGATASIIDGGTEGRQDFEADRVMEVGAGVRVHLIGITIRGGGCESGAAGILNWGNLTIEDSHVRDNLMGWDFVFCRRAGFGGAGIQNQGQLTVLRSTLAGNYEPLGDAAAPGGALLNLGHATIVQSVIEGNGAGGGGGIANYGDVDISDTEIRSNAARFWGAGIESYSGNVVLTRTTVSNNADGGILSWGGTLTMRNSTVSGNTSNRIAGALNLSVTAEIDSSTIADNRGSRAPDCNEAPCPLPVAGIQGSPRLTNTIVSNPGYADCWDPVISLGHNLDHDGTCGLNAGGDLSGTSAILGPLAANGGRTRTHALLLGSPAIDRNPSAPCTVATDQRGVVRPQPNPGSCDAGAYEFAPAVDIAAIIRQVAILSASLTKDQGIALLAPLKPAHISATLGEWAAVCHWLGVFTVTLSGDVSDGLVPSESARPILEAVARVRSTVCHA